MKITIDTKEDNHEEIRKVISLLQNLINGSVGSYSNYGNSSSGSSNPDTSNLMSMFGDVSTPAMPAKEVSDNPPDFSSFTNLISNKTSEKKEPVEIEESSKIEFF